jgi:adenylate cyclase class IV
MQTKRNIELKARCGDLASAAEAARALGATFSGVLEQLDTYFHARDGRLKLREIAGQAEAQLIWYARPDSVELRGSDYYVVPVGYPVEARAALSAALGVRGEVRKRRDLWLWQNVRIHLDDVESLGTFVEFEAVLADDRDEGASLERLAILTDALRIRPADRVAVSYGDLLGL